MPKHPHRTVREWLDAERAGRTEDADRRFRAVAAVLPPFQPSAGFADAVMARAGFSRPRPDVWANWWIRGAIAAALLLVGALAVSLPATAWFDALLASVQQVARGLGLVSAGASAWIGSALVVWASLAHAASAVGRLMTGPGPLVLVTCNFALAVAAFWALRRLMPLQEN
jgi:hypothetical protein